MGPTFSTQAPQFRAAGAAPRRSHRGRGGRGAGAAEAVSGGALLCLGVGRGVVENPMGSGKLWGKKPWDFGGFQEIFHGIR